METPKLAARDGVTLPKEQVLVVNEHGTYPVHLRWLDREYFRIVRNMINNGSREGYLEVTRNPRVQHEQQRID